ncbi:MAG: hypothetical protein OM95_13885 [Bdellovibrio sp. ArHS]|uniref:SRPBCC family protein n=1 Tax=Bdellovibrio sp. ArHS TaxID=1569284 RepID=UPI0005826859|nr:SRPBCC domain-containing protein [Bdellovibrio sp. ArHS]KHD87533.1 MAG: hypothetical protein OM95_13885 [Bdellovibrio sp. ArHS]
MKDVIELSISIKAPTAWIWKALTDSSELENWWSDDVILQAKVGGTFKEPWEDDEGEKQLASGKVLAVKNEKHLIFTWREKNWPKNADTQCSFLIEDKGTVRTLTVKHEGWESLPETQRASVMKDFKVGWNYHLKELKSYLDD